MNYAPFTTVLKRLFFGLSPLYIGEAGEEIGTKIKPADGTPVTSLDHRTLERLRSLIAEHFPCDITIGEEDRTGPEEIRRLLEREDQFQWTIDGLDGTGNLRLGTNSYGAALARRYGNNILYAAAFRPVDYALRGNGFFFAERGQGTWEWFNYYHPLSAAPADRLDRMVILLEGSSKKFFEPPITYLGRAETTRSSLSSCVAATTVARGRASALFTVENKPWDNWPSWLFIQEAGGTVTGWQGEPLTPSNCGNMVAAANGTDHERIIELLNL